MSTTVAQWQAGKAVEGVPPWDGTGFPFPFNADGSPAWPTPPEPLTLTLTSVQPPGDLVEDTSINLSAAASVPPAVNMVRFDYRVNGAAWDSRNPGGVGGPPGGPYGMSGMENTAVGDVLEYRAANPPGPVADDTADTVYSNVLTWNIIDAPSSAFPAPTVDPNPVVIGSSSVVTAVATGTVTGGVSVGHELNGAAFTVLGSMTEDPPGTWTGSYPSDFRLDTDTAVVKITNGGLQSEGTPVTFAPVVVAVEGWTVAELKQFAADHDPVIPVPSSANKAEILAIIVAYLNAHPEEN